MAIYGNILESVQNNNVYYESYLIEKVQITPPKGKWKNYETDIDFKGLKIEIGTYNNTSEEQAQNEADYLEKDFPVFKSNFDKLVKKAFEELYKKCEDWNMENIKSSTQLMKMVSLDHIIYNYNKRENVGNFECWYNAYGKCDEFFGNHSFIVNIGVENNKKAFTTSADLEG